ncbi:uncharacterized protein LOC113499051 isoform X2 [Trichoplusia ni]|nr:uncharacterized protein LOC113499051 isoform X2 [Trichoplusia ni]
MHRGIHAQYQQVYPSPNGTFKFMKFEWMNRGGYNISTCLKDLMNCWEVMRGDVICAHAKHTQTICEHMKEECSDYYGYLDNWYHGFSMMEAVCHDGEYQQYSRRKISPK